MYYIVDIDNPKLHYRLYRLAKLYGFIFGHPNRETWKLNNSDYEVLYVGPYKSTMMRCSYEYTKSPHGFGYEVISLEEMIKYIKNKGKYEPNIEQTQTK